MVIVNITSYIGSGAAFKEFRLLIEDTVLENGCQYILSREINPHMLNIILGAAHTPEYYLNQELPPNTIIVNLEQLYDDCRWEGRYIELLSKYRVWDYNMINIKWLSKRGIKAELFQRLYSPKLNTIRLTLERHRYIDVLFYGTLTENRSAVKRKLSAMLPDKNIVFVVDIWGEERDFMISRSKIVLNIHGYPSNIFESSRVCHLLSNGAFVISEKSVDDNDYSVLDHGLIRVEYKDICDTVSKYLELPEERTRVSNYGYEAVKHFENKIPDLLI